MREYFWHIIVIFGLCLGLLFGAIALGLRFSHSITYTDGVAPSAPSITVADPQRGPKDAPVTLVVYSDFSCEGCKNLHEILTTAIAAHPNDIRLVWKDMPNEDRHPQAMAAAIAARCAEQQGFFWEYSDKLFSQSESFSDAVFQGIGTELGMNIESLAACREQEKTRPLVERTLSEGLALEISATPTLFINNERYTGSISQDALEKILRPYLK